MARLNDPSASDEDLPELSTILQPRTDAIPRIIAQTPKQEHGKTPSRKDETQILASEELLTERYATSPRTVSQVSSDEAQSRKQRPLGHLKQAHVNSLLLPMSDTSINTIKSEDYHSIDIADNVSNRAVPRRLAKITAVYSKLAQVSADTSTKIPDDGDDDDDDDDSSDLSGFIVPDSASDEEVLVSKSPKKRSQIPVKIPIANPQESCFPTPRRSQYIRRQPSRKTDVVSPVMESRSRIFRESPTSNEHFRSELVEAQPSLDYFLTL